MTGDVQELHEVLLDLMGILNEPQRHDAALVKAGTPLDRALAVMLVRISRHAPIGVVDLAALSGRDHSTVSRQVARLQRLGFVTRKPGAHDSRVREARLTHKGRMLIAAFDRVREQVFGPKFARWSAQDRAHLLRLLRRLMADIRDLRL